MNIKDIISKTKEELKKPTPIIKQFVLNESEMAEIVMKLSILQTLRELIDSTKETYFLKCPKKSPAGQIIAEWVEGD